MSSLSTRAPPENPAAEGTRAARPSVGFVAMFAAFYAEVLLQKRRVTLSASPPTCEVVKQRLVDLYQAQAVSAARRYAEHEIAAFEEVQYIMVAMADEVFLHLDWSGRAPWAAKPMESEIFRSHDAGERFFRRLDELLAGRAPGSSELLTVYLTALAVGFRGRYAFEDPTRPEAYRHRLAAHLARVDPDRTSADRTLFPEALGHTLSSEKKRRLPSWSRGLLPLGIVIVGWLLLGELFWYYRTVKVDDMLDRIEASQ